MHTYLELVKALARKSGSMDEDQITTVVGLSGRSRKMANWVQEAYDNIQNHRRDWGWLVADFSWPLIIGTSVYTAASFNLTRFASWIVDKGWYKPLTIYDPAIGVSDETAIPQISYEEYRTTYGRGDQTDLNRPIAYAITPRNEIAFGPYPDLAYVVHGQYVKGPQTLVNNSDAIEMPERFARLVVWEALRLMMLDDGAYDEATFPTVEMANLRHELEIDQLPEVCIP